MGGIFLALIIIGFVAYRRSGGITGPRTIGDAEDGGTDYVWAVGLGLGGLFFLFGAYASAFAARRPSLGLAALALIAAVITFAAAWFTFDKQRREGRVASAATLDVSVCPMPGGEDVRLRLTRALRQDVRPSKVRTVLRLEEHVQRGKSSTWVTRFEQAIPTSQVRVEGDALVVEWDMIAPPIDPREGQWFSSWASPRKYRWHLYVQTPVPGAEDLDSRFYIPFAFPATA